MDEIPQRGVDGDDPEPEKPEISGWAKVSLGTGILAITLIPVMFLVFLTAFTGRLDGSSIAGVLSLAVPPTALGVLAIVFARIAKRRILHSDLEGIGIATAGQTLGIVSLVLVSFGLFVFFMQDRLRDFVGDFFNWETIKFWWPKVGRAFLTTLKLAVVSEVCILVFGLLLAMLRISKLRTFRVLAAIYIDVIRGIPLILQIFIIYFGLSYLGLNFSRFTAGVVALTVCYAAYEAEIFRAGIESIHKGQMEASRSLGMTYLQSMRYVVLPQAVRRVIPPLSNEFIMLTKDTALVAFIGLSEAFLVGKEGMGRDANVTPLVGVALFFLLVTIPAMRVVQYLETRLAKGD
jgi:His/Glu/Gln/Arg/opine family amino acid ABC transporter permease subunit